ncbi:MAG: hypothetical protein JJU29_23650 [Verrucomicrobia bacterium]|nr:hypothetical protein [Verrucomicrobiota bacterium]MCH8510359.1 hypothetical protein [Kiritimatiellia bacterium]
MTVKLKDVANFRGDRLFDGAVNIDWLEQDEKRSNSAATSFVFHGPEYHGVVQSEVGNAHGHHLQDTATFARDIVRRCYGIESQSFTLAIAGYGTGKSHFALTLAELLRQPDGETAEAILSGLEVADPSAGFEIRNLLTETNHPCLVVALNGMQNFDLAAQVTRQIISQVKSQGLDTRALDALRPRFSQAASLVQMAMTNPEVAAELKDACMLSDIKQILEKLQQQDDSIYSKVHDVLSSKNIKISALGGESVRDVIDVTAREFCGDGKPYKSLVVLFDEFGRYTEFAAGKSHITGSGALQSLFEGIQNNTQSSCFIGFIQYELNAYIQRVAPENRAEITRYVTRYQNAARVYLSINLETLIASLIEKPDSQFMGDRFENENIKDESREMLENISRWFPQSANHQIWCNLDKFHSVIRKGCWPLSVYSTWFLFHLASAGKHLQERSALALLGDAFKRYENQTIDNDGSWTITPVDLWTEDLKNEFLVSEEAGQQGSITHAYTSIVAKHGSHLNLNQDRILRAVVIASKLRLKAEDKDDAVNAISDLTGLHLKVVGTEIDELQDNLNVLEWDKAFKAFDILGDAVPRSQFLSYLRNSVKDAYDEEGKAKLFASKASTWCDLLSGIEPDFAEENGITTLEWKFLSATSTLDLLPIHLKQATNRWEEAVTVDDPRGAVIYCYVESKSDPEKIQQQVSGFLKNCAKTSCVPAHPILVVLLHDENGDLGQSLAELSVLEEGISDQDRAKFGNLVSAHKEKCLRLVREQVEYMLKQRRYATGFKEPFESERFSRVGSEIFSRIYKSPLSFPFDGFTTKSGNAASDCFSLTMELLHGRLDWNGVTAKPVRIQNRAINVLRDKWGIFAKDGKIKTRPSHPTVKKVTEIWDDLLSSGEKKLELRKCIQDVCSPPYGANLASASLLLGVFIAPRINKLFIQRSEERITVSDWLKDAPFRGNFIDLGSLHDTSLLLSGDESSEWDELLEEWEQAESYAERISCYLRSENLQQRLPVPPIQAYKKVYLEQLGKNALIEKDKFDKLENEALNKIENGIHRKDVALLTWGAADLCDLSAKMTSEKPLWSDDQIGMIDPQVTRASQNLIQIFPHWLKTQMPRDPSPKAVGDFNHVMIRKIGSGLKKLGLIEQFDLVEEHTNAVLKQVEKISEARQLVNDVQSWIMNQNDSRDIPRVDELRANLKVGKGFSSKIRSLASRFQAQMPELLTTQTDLTTSLLKTEKKLSVVENRLKTLLKSNIKSVEDLEILTDEVGCLIVAFEGSGKELEDLKLMRKALMLYQSDYNELSDQRLTWSDYSNLAESLCKKNKLILEDTQVPWLPENIFPVFLQEITSKRDNLSNEWLKNVQKNVLNIDSLSVSEANRLYGQASNPPPYLTETDLEALQTITSKIENRLNNLKIEWLTELFSDLSPEMKKRFIEIAKKLLS